MELAGRLDDWQAREDESWDGARRTDLRAAIAGLERIAELIAVQARETSAASAGYRHEGATGETIAADAAAAAALQAWEPALSRSAWCVLEAMVARELAA
ncbi:MAG: hypothetical protein ACREQ5_35695, partial [Candidatus Dormibacteria bacterium]